MVLPTRPLTRLLPLTLVAGLALVAPTTVGGPAPSPAAAVTAAAPPAAAPAAAGRAPYLVGRGIADVTGEPAEVGMMGYADFTQTTDGLHMRQRSRAFVIVDRRSGRRVVHVTADVGMFFQNMRDAVLERLRARFGGVYGERNVMLTATHTHSGPGGYSHHNMYNLTTMGFHDRTYQAVVDGVVASIARAHEDLAPARLGLATTQLTNASANRSRGAFALNPARDRAFFPTGTDTQSTTLRVTRGGRLDGIINWFPVHATSMSTNNHLISPDNKGYAGYHWERDLAGVDYLREARDPDFVAAFAQTNAGDMSPNLNLRPTDGPTRDEFRNTRIIGDRMVGAARSGRRAVPLRGGVDSRLVYVDMSDVAVDGRFTPDGKPHRTCSPALGAAFAAGSTEDGGGGLPVFHEGEGGGNPVFDLLSEVLYTVSPTLDACQSPKEVLVPAGALGLIQEIVPVQLVRIGGLYLIGIPAEVTIVAGLRLRRAVADVVGVPVRRVLVQGYANHYAHYVTTPEEYDSQNYEGASTVFGRYELPALTQVSVGLARSMVRGTRLPLGEKAAQPAVIRSPLGTAAADTPPAGGSFGDVTTPPAASYSRGRTVTVAFAGAHPNNDLRHGSTYLTVERRVGGRWKRVADDGDWSTKLRWARSGLAGSTITISWDIPQKAALGRYRIRYFGDAKVRGALTPISGTSPPFRVR